MLYRCDLVLRCGEALRILGTRMSVAAHLGEIPTVPGLCRPVGESTHGKVYAGGNLHREIAAAAQTSSREMATAVDRRNGSLP